MMGDALSKKKICESVSIVDFDYCASSFLALRHVNRSDVMWKLGWEPSFYRRDTNKSIPVFSAKQMSELIEESLTLALQQNKLGIMLSGGMDSAILASYLPPGTKAYTLRAKESGALNEVENASLIANMNKLELHVVDFSFEDYMNVLPALMESKRAPLHSIEPQIVQGLRLAKSHGVEAMVFGELADSLFGGFDQLLTYSNNPASFIERYIFLDPKVVLKQFVDIKSAFDPFIRDGVIEKQLVMENLFADESLNSYINPCKSEHIKLIAPFAHLRMGSSLDIERIRLGDSKYLVRELFKLRYPDMQPPEKRPMPRAVSIYLRDWEGPTHPIFRKFDQDALTPDQRWYVFSLEFFTRLMERS